MSTGNWWRADSPSNTTGDMTGGLTQDTLRRLHLEKFENNRTNVAETETVVRQCSGVIAIVGGLCSIRCGKVDTCDPNVRG